MPWSLSGCMATLVPKACDPVLNAWITAGHLTKKLVWQRVELAIENNQMPLARYLKRFLQSTDQPWVDRWIGLHQNPTNPQRILRESHPYADEIVVDTIRRLVRKDAIKALDIWQDIHDNPRFSDQQHLTVVRTLASFLALKNNQTTLQRLRNLLPVQLRDDPKFNDKILQVALRQNDWKLVLNIIENLAPEEREKGKLELLACPGSHPVGQR